MRVIPKLRQAPGYAAEDPAEVCAQVSREIMDIRRPEGFTLIEVMIVVIILGVLAAVAVPRFTVSSEDAKTAALNTDLAILEPAIEMYKHQHRGKWPGAAKYTDGSAVTSVSQAEDAIVRQLTLHSDASGVTSNTRTSVYRYGPYLKQGIPRNPFNGSSDVTCNITESDLTVAAGSSADGTGWKFYVITGRMIPNHEDGKLVIKEVFDLVK